MLIPTLHILGDSTLLVARADKILTTTDLATRVGIYKVSMAYLDWRGSRIITRASNSPPA